MSGAGGRRRALGCGAFALALVVGCAGPKQTARPADGDGEARPEETNGRDAGARLWVAHHALRDGAKRPRQSVLELVVEPAFTPERSVLACPSPLVACEAGAGASDPTPAKRTRLTFYWQRDEAVNDEDVPECTATGLVETTVRIACEERLDKGLTLEPRGDELFVRLHGAWWYGGSATAAEVERVFKVTVDELGQPTELTLQRAAPLRVAFERTGQPSRAGSSETRHLSALVDPFEKVAAQVPELSVDAIEAIVVERGFDPRTLPLETAFDIERGIAQYRMYALRMPPAERSSLAREVVDEQLKALEEP